MTETPTPTGIVRPRRVLITAAIVTAAVIGGGFWLAAQFQSSAQQEANAQAPTPGPVFAEVSEGTLSADVSFTGDLGPSQKTSITILPAAGASIAVVTGRPLEDGTTATSGHVLTEVNGRPLFGVESAFSFYRDMGFGDSGPDVAALQSALAARSYPVAADGRFGPETAAAVTRWYEDSGYDVPTPRAATEEGADPGKDVDGASGGAGSTPRGYVPVTEVLAIPSASAQVIQGTRVGQRLAVEGNPDLILGSADVVVTVTIPVTDLAEVVEGDPAVISVGGADVEGTIGAIRASDSADASGEEEATEQEVTFAVTPSAALPDVSGRARVVVRKKIVAQDALIVPILAVADRGAEKTVLTKREDDGTLTEIAVIVLGSLQGEVAIAPAEKGALAPGDRVRVG